MDGDTTQPYQAPAPQPKVVQTEHIPSGIAFSVRIPTIVIAAGCFVAAKYLFKGSVPVVLPK